MEKNLHFQSKNGENLRFQAKNGEMEKASNQNPFIFKNRGSGGGSGSEAPQTTTRLARSAISRGHEGHERGALGGYIMGPGSQES